MHKQIVLSIYFASLLGLASCHDNRRALAISKIKGAAKLATTEVTLSKMIFATKEKAIILGLIKLDDAIFAARTMATVKAGINLDEISSTDVKIEGNTITIALPPVKVLDFSYPFQSYKVDFSITENSLANRISVQEHEVLYRNAELEIRKLLPSMGIKEATERNTRQLLEKLLFGLGYTEVNISFRPGDFIEVTSITVKDLQIK